MSQVTSPDKPQTSNPNALVETSTLGTKIEAATILELSDVSVAYGAIGVLSNINLSLPRGGVVAILGANGAGKTTALRAISCVLGYHGGAVTSGTVRFNGTDISKATPATLVRSGMAQVMEGRRIFSELTVHENLKTGAYTRKDKAATAESYEEVMDLFPRLRERRNQVAGYMSGGEQQMLAMGRALMANPKLLLLDEPSLGLAPLIVEQIFSIVAAINRKGTTVLIVEQNASMALRHSDYGYVVENGKIAMSGPSAELLNNDSIKELYLGGESQHTSFRNLKSYRKATEYLA